MSFDPFHEQQPPRDPAPQPGSGFTPSRDPAPRLNPENVPLGGDAPGGLPAQAATAARERLLFPAILLIVAGILNFLFAGIFGFLGFLMTPEFLERTMN